MNEPLDDGGVERAVAHERAIHLKALPRDVRRLHYPSLPAGVSHLLSLLRTEDEADQFT